MKVIGLAGLFLAASLSPGICAGYDDLNAGIAARNRGDWDSTIVYLDKALAANDLNPDLQYVAHFDRAQARAAKGDMEGRLEDLTACIELRAGDKAALLDRTILNIWTNKLDAARQDVDTIIAGDQTDPDVYVIRANIYEIQGNPEKELEDLNTALEKGLSSKRVRLLIGIAQLQLGKADDAAVSFTNSLEASPSYGWLWLAITGLKQGKPVPASAPPANQTWPGPIVDFFRGISPEDTVFAAAGKGDGGAKAGQVCEANFYLGKWRQLHGDTEGAKTLIKKAASDCPRDFIEWYAAMAELKNVS